MLFRSRIVLGDTCAGGFEFSGTHLPALILGNQRAQLRIGENRIGRKQHAVEYKPLALGFIAGLTGSSTLNFVGSLGSIFIRGSVCSRSTEPASGCTWATAGTQTLPATATHARVLERNLRMPQCSPRWFNAIRAKRGGSPPTLCLRRPPP